MPNSEAPACECRWFEQMVKDDSVPIVFDEVMNEYQLVHSNGYGHVILYYCPSCGGHAPKSLRDTYWTEVSMEESYRLNELTKDIKTPDELFARLGPPDDDFAVSGGSISPSSQDQPPVTVLGPRRVVYKSLSETVEVHVKIDRYDRLSFSFSGRYIGPN